MALTILIRSQLDAIPTLADVCYTQANYGGSGSTTLSVNTPRGVLGGSVAAISAGGGDYTVYPANGATTSTPIGLFVNDAAGAAFENAPAVASGKVTVIKGMGSVEVDVYENVVAVITGGQVNGVYTLGDKLYASAYGLLTNTYVQSQSPVIGIVTKVPTTTSPTLGLDMRI